MIKHPAKISNRPELENLKQFVREGDIVVVHSMDRIACNLDDLRQIVWDFTNKGIRIQFVKENFMFSGEDSPLANLLLSVIGAFAEFERALIRERQREGIASAKKRRAYKGRKKSLTNDQIIIFLTVTKYRYTKVRDQFLYSGDYVLVTIK